MEEIVSSKENSEFLKHLRRSDCSTDIEERSSLTSVFSRQSLGLQTSFSFYGLPLTPKSDLFLQPNESPEYVQLNKCLQELYFKLEDEITPSCFEDMSEKTVKVKNTACSSLLQRRNNSFVCRSAKNLLRH